MTNSQARQADERTIELANAPAKSDAMVEVGSIIQERYRVLNLLGRGGMGSVYHVRSLKSESDFALKLLDRHAGESSARRFEIEAKVANRLDHPNLIKVHDSGVTEDGQPFLVMEYVPGMTLSAHLQRKGRLTVAQALNIFIQVGFALAYAHENGLIHRDLKPSNIMLIEDTAGSLCSSVKLVDLGIAKWTAEEEYAQQTLTKTGEVFGSPLYMSPEQCKGVPVDRRSDLYSLGCVIYESLTGAPPFVGDNALSTMMKHQAETPLSLKEASLGIEFPQAVELVVAKLLEKDPDKRYSNAQLVTAELVTIQQSIHEKQDSTKTLLTAAQKEKRCKEAEAIFSTRNLICSLIVLASYGLGFLTGHVTTPSDAPQKKPSNVTRIEENPNGVPRDYVEVMEGESPKGKDPYMNTGKEYFTKQSGKQIICKFPSRSIGKIGIQDPDKLPVFMTDAWGEKTIPRGLLAFEGNSELMLYPRMLEKFRPGELGALVLENGNRRATKLLRILPLQKNLLYLSLNDTWVDNHDLLEIGKLPELQQLYLGGSQIDSNAMTAMENLNKLKCLDITESMGASKLLVALSNSRAMELLRLKRCSIKPEDLEAIGKICNLKKLDLKANKNITDESLKWLASLKYLRELNLEQCPISKRGLSFLKSLPLKKLTITDYDFTPDEIREIKDDFPHLLLRPKPDEKGTQMHYVLDSFEIK